MLHQIGKANLYIDAPEWAKKNGKFYEFNNLLVPMRVSERSIFYATSNSITFTQEEYSAILMFDKTDDKQAEYYNSTLGDLLKMASLFAIKHEKNNK